LPMIRMRRGGEDAPWEAYTPAELAAWKEALMAAVVGAKDDDF